MIVNAQGVEKSIENYIKISNMTDTKEEWISVSSLAKREGVTAQTIRNRIARGMYQTKEFERGSMKGILVLSRMEVEG